MVKAGYDRVLEERERQREEALKRQKEDNKNA